MFLLWECMVDDVTAAHLTLKDVSNMGLLFFYDVVETIVAEISVKQWIFCFCY